MILGQDNLGESLLPKEIDGREFSHAGYDVKIHVYEGVTCLSFKGKAHVAFNVTGRPFAQNLEELERLAKAYAESLGK